MQQYSINLDRLRDDLLDLAKIGRNSEDNGVYRPGFSDDDMQSRQWLIALMKEGGLTAGLDKAGNVVGRFGESKEAAVVTGSHIDSVPCGGIFDGTLGVIAGLECVRVIKEKNIEIKRPIEVIAFAEEEGRFGGMFGVQAICGQVTLDWIQNAVDEEGIYLKDLMAKHGLDPEHALDAKRDRSEFSSFIELHIEQGPVLDTIKKPIGIVEGISGVFKWHIKLIGKADHAGTAPMNLRSDAFMGLADFAHEIPRIIDEEGTEKSRLTIGRVDLKPGFAHTVPGEVQFTLVGRDMKNEVMTNLAGSCHKVLSAIARRYKLRFEYDESSWLDPQDCHPDIINAFEKQARAMGFDYEMMPSGAGHDTQFMCQLTRGGMIFVPSVNGVSHAPDEMTHWSDIEQGANLLLNTMVDLANE